MSRLSRTGRDRNFAEFLRAEFGEQEWSEAAAWASLYAEGLNAADSERMSTH